MLRLLIWGLLIYVGYRIILSLVTAKNQPAKPLESSEPVAETYRDPVCGLYVTEEQAVIGKHDGQRHYFCSMNCLDKFREQLEH